MKGLYLKSLMKMNDKCDILMLTVFSVIDH